MPTPLSKLPAFADALVAALRLRAGIATPPGGLPAVQVSSGTLAPDDMAAETISLLDADADTDWVVVKAAPGGRHDEAARQQLLVEVNRSGGGEAVIVATRARCFAIADEIADLLDTDPTCSGTVRNGRVARWQLSQGAAAEVGRWARLRLVVTYTARI
jgi:hypothetical protein